MNETQAPSGNAWGDAQTRFFFELTPDRVLEAVEALGLRCSGRCTALNSFENRVYEIELEEEDDSSDRSASAAFARRRVVKFYRPGRWNREQILEEHEFLLDLKKSEIPVVAPIEFEMGAEKSQTLHVAQESGIFYALFPKVGGRSPDELQDDQLRWIGRLLARIHSVGALKPALHRIGIGPETYGRKNLASLLEGNWIPLEYAARYQQVVEEICSFSDDLFSALPVSAIHRIHGDCHLGNLLWNQSGPFFLDFDDMVRGPAVQDIWLLVPGRDEESIRQRQILLEGYEEMREFNFLTLRLIEPLRALRFVHYSAWIARRWSDPAFPAAFPQFGTHRYWQEQLRDLEEQLLLMKKF
ncbi:MAG: serine/threonine protein kinase [Bdellovibrionia bacterium]